MNQMRADMLGCACPPNQQPKTGVYPSAPTAEGENRHVTEALGRLQENLGRIAAALDQHEKRIDAILKPAPCEPDAPGPSPQRCELAEVIDRLSNDAFNFWKRLFNMTARVDL